MPLLHPRIVLYRLSTSNHNRICLQTIYNILSYIVFLHQTTTAMLWRPLPSYCLISSFYIKPQLAARIRLSAYNCLISSFYIKPQLYPVNYSRQEIVLYRLSTSNHNSIRSLVLTVQIVLYRLSTSNHNTWMSLFNTKLLSYIVFLHQTTTGAGCSTGLFYCLISSFYIKPQLAVVPRQPCRDCLISSFYIKPQRRGLHTRSCGHCLISSFYIKPQPDFNAGSQDTIVLYRLSTSNHNFPPRLQRSNLLSYIVFLHQTTTASTRLISWTRLSYIVFLHQTTTSLIYSSDYQSV